MAWREQLHVNELCDRRVPEPRESLEGQKQLAVVKKKPKAVRRDVGYFNAGSGFARLRGSHLRAPGPASRRQQAAVGSARSSRRLRSLAQARSSPPRSGDERERAFSALLARRSRTDTLPRERSSGSRVIVLHSGVSGSNGLTIKSLAGYVFSLARPRSLGPNAKSEAISATCTTLSSLSSPSNTARLGSTATWIFLELARGYRARTGRVGQPCP